MKTIKKIMLIILATIFLIMIKSNVCSAYQTHTSQAEYFKGESGLNTIIQQKEKAVGDYVYIGDSYMKTLGNNMLYCSQQQKNNAVDQNYQVVYYMEIKGKTAKFSNVENGHAGNNTPLVGELRNSTIGGNKETSILATALASFENSRGYADEGPDIKNRISKTQRVLWYFLYDHKSWIDTNFGSYFENTKLNGNAVYGKQDYNNIVNKVNNGQGYTGIIRIWWIAATKSTTSQNLMLVEVGGQEDTSTKVRVVKQDSSNKRAIMGAKFQLQMKFNGQTTYLKNITQKEDGSYQFEWTYDKSSATTYTTDKWGKLYFNDLPATLDVDGVPVKAEYELVEIEPADGYKKARSNYDQRKTFDLTTNKVLNITFENTPDETEMLLIEKRDGSDGSSMGGVVFKVRNNSTGKWIKTATLVLEDEEENERNTYELGNASVGQNEWWTTNESEAMRFVTGSQDEYRGIKIMNLPGGSYTVKEIANPYGKYQKNIGRTWNISTTKVDDYRNTYTIQNYEDGNNYGNVKISGMVWEDIFTGKGGNNNNRKDSNEKGLEGVTVTWKTPGGSVLTSTSTNSDGEYTMYSRINYSFCQWWMDTSKYNAINNSYIEFTYNGLVYTTVAYASDGSEDKSKAMENPSSRAALDNSFAEISNRGISPNGSRVSYESGRNNGMATSKMTSPLGITDFGVTADTRTPLRSYRLLETYPELVTGERSGCLRHHYVSCSKHGSHHRCDERGSKTVRWEVYNINCGLVKREQPDIAIISDVSKVDVIMKGQQYTYKYGNRGIEGTGADYKVAFGDGTTYRRAVNPSDIAYINKDGNNSEDLEVYVTYKMKVNNQSNTLVMNGAEIVNYFDANMTLADDRWSMTSKNGDTYNSNGFKGAYTQQLKDEKIGPGQTSSVIEIRLKVNNDTLKDLIKKDALFKNVSEIYMYSTFYGSNTLCAQGRTASSNGVSGRQCAGIDVDSQPGSTKMSASGRTLDTSTYEDDTDVAPTFMLVKDNSYKEISGNIFEDTKVGNDHDRLGNGIKDGGENGVANVKVELLRVYDDGPKTETADLYTINGTSPSTTPAITWTDPNGNYNFTGIVVDNYIIRYTYGGSCGPDGNATVILNQYPIDGRNYKSTIVTQDPVESIMKTNIDNSTGLTQQDLLWHLNLADNVSTAVDDIDDLHWSYRKKDNTLVNVNVNGKNEEEESGRMLDEDARLQIEPLINKNFNDPTNVSAYSLPFKVQVEYTPEQEFTVSTDGGSFPHNWSKFNFGIIERTREDIVVDKTIDRIRITLANGQVLTEGSPYEEGMDYVRALGPAIDEATRKDTVNTRVKYINAMLREREVFMEMDSELIQGSTLEILYKITVTNNSEVDYEYDSVLGGNEKYYYYGESPTTLIRPSVEYLVDYVDPELTCEVGEGTQNVSWQQLSAEDLHNAGNISDEVYERVKKEAGNYSIFVTNSFKNIEPGASHTETLYASKLLATQAKDHVYENHAEIVQLNGKIARTIDRTTNGEQVEKTYKPGNYIPSRNIRIDGEDSETKRKHEQDDDSVTVIITPPTGLKNREQTYDIAKQVGKKIKEIGITYMKNINW